ncbi:hypothetical protein [Glycomyces terrestris]|uniref:Lipoprotein n=1 Tax=Glycomyces terrestris TaxID=2493553 RepID=A0A426V408_9ACTN|nr:hypothetical protein [Glycomyces terrestris]RRS01575.1 hypothetical protein EIW28_02060 [Glycomyces terrestris]
MKWNRIAALAVCCGALAACGSQRADDASAAAEAFLTALADGDAAAVCAALAPETAQALASSEDQTCEQAVAALDLPTGTVGETDVWGDRAQVRTGTDVLFLAELDEGWKVVAAGCEPQGERPYECEVSA